MARCSWVFFQSLPILHGKLRATVMELVRPDARFEVRTAQAVAGVIDSQVFCAMLNHHGHRSRIFRCRYGELQRSENGHQAGDAAKVNVGTGGSQK